VWWWLVGLVWVLELARALEVMVRQL